MPTISIIVPVYNVEKYVQQCLTSISKQSFSDFECIIIDDGSTDNSGKICDEFAYYDPRFRVIHQNNQRLSKARNKGLDLAKGEFICFVDSDDLISPKYCEFLLKAIKDTKSPIAIIKCRTITQDANQTDEEYKDNYNIFFIKHHDLVRYSFNNQLKPNLYVGYAWNKIYRKCFISQERFIDTTCEDLEFNLRLFKRTEQLPVVNAIGYYYRQREDSITYKDRIAFSSRAIQDQLIVYYRYFIDADRSLKSDILWLLFRKLCSLRLLSIHTAQEDEVFTLSKKLYKQKHKELKKLLHWPIRWYIKLALYSPIVHKVALSIHIFFAKYR